MAFPSPPLNIHFQTTLSTLLGHMILYLVSYCIYVTMSYERGLQTLPCQLIFMLSILGVYGSYHLESYNEHVTITLQARD